MTSRKRRPNQDGGAQSPANKESINGRNSRQSEESKAARSAGDSSNAHARPNAMALGSLRSAKLKVKGKGRAAKGEGKRDARQQGVANVVLIIYFSLFLFIMFFTLF